MLLINLKLYYDYPFTYKSGYKSNVESEVPNFETLYVGLYAARVTQSNPPQFRHPHWWDVYTVIQRSAEYSYIWGNCLRENSLKYGRSGGP